MNSLYIHVPFCIRKCPYCDFYSSTDRSLIPQFIHALSKELRLKKGKQHHVQTVYFGGGTPSLLSIQQVALILKVVDEYFLLDNHPEISFEINPGTVDFQYLSDLRNTGVNRISIGVQSFDDEKLLFLNRIHDSQQACQAVDDVKKAGFDNISLDLIYGLPFEDRARWKKDIHKAVQKDPQHLSCYMLTIEPGTPLHRQQEKGMIFPVDEKVRSELFQDTVQELNRSGFEHYEISNFAKGRASRSRHNSQYWQMTPYMGLGPSAHSFDGHQRSWNHPDILTYIQKLQAGGQPAGGSETLTNAQKKLETIMLSLRTMKGVCLNTYHSRFGIRFEDEFSAIIEKVAAQSFGSVSHERFALTLKGKCRLDSIVEAFADQIVQ